MSTRWPLRNIDLSGNFFTASHAPNLVRALENATALTALHLWNNDLADAGVKVISESSTLATRLVCLNLAQNRVKVEGARCLAKMIAQNGCSLKSLHVYQVMSFACSLCNSC